MTKPELIQALAREIERRDVEETEQSAETKAMIRQLQKLRFSK